ncbi:uncharacterized protein LOC123523190 [Mercenaria mercenaria]|uniref:uncharacterized protein LOC123523190 n=1 Tax=Mercenaria mercenaria TaxID=6596 RepID=UPI00234F3372|nr:uncharacterized protein LOC123523190 [Mercenaria mercenaria]
MNMNEGLFSRYNSYSDIYKYFPGLKTEPIEETVSSHPENSVEDLEAISGNLICQGVLRKFRYLQRKMEMESAQQAESKAKSKTERAGKSASETVDNVEKNSTKTSEKKLSVANSGETNEGIKCKKPAHMKTNARKTDRQTKESIRKAKVELEQTKLYNKLLKAAESGESSFCDSDCETENKLFDKVGGPHGTKTYGDKEVRNVPNNVNLETSQVSKQSCFVKNGQKGAKTSIDVNRNPNGRRKLDWPEQLLFLEMTHSDFDEQTHISESDRNDCSERITEIEPEGLRVAGIHETAVEAKDAEQAEDDHKTEKNKVMEPNCFKITSKKMKFPKTGVEAKEKKTKKRKERSTLDEDMNFGEKTLKSQVMKIRETKVNRKRSKTSTDTQFKEIGSSLEDKDSFDSGIDSSVTNQTNNFFTDAKSFNGIRPCFETSTPCRTKTPYAKQTNNKRHWKRKTRKTKKCEGSSLNVFDENANRHSLEVIRDVSSETSLLNLSLPTPRPPRVDLNPFSLSYDGQNMDDECSSDEDLPVGLTPLKIEKTFNENDIVWVKWKKWPHLPALVKKVYKKKRRITCAVFGPNGFEEDFTMGYGNPGAVIPYCDPKKDQILEEAEKLCKDDKVFFKGSCTHAENFLTKEALKGLESTGVFKENVHHEDNEVENGHGNEEQLTQCRKKRKLSEKHTDSDCTITKVEGKNDGLSKQGQQRIERMSKKTKPLTDFLVSDTTKEYLQSIYNGNIHSDLHDRFLSGTVRERAKMKHRGFGPIDDDDQIELLLNTYLNLLKEINKKNIDEINYVFDVWVPEGVVFALKKMKGYSWKRAWEQFNKGVRRTKEELRMIHKDMIDIETSRKQISDKPTDFIL